MTTKFHGHTYRDQLRNDTNNKMWHVALINNKPVKSFMFPLLPNRMYSLKHTVLQEQEKILDPLTHIQRNNLNYIEDLYQQYKTSPESIERDWRIFFEGFDFSKPVDNHSQEKVSGKEVNVYNLIQDYRNHGHFEANLDPLKLQKKTSGHLSLKKHGLSNEDLESKFQIGSILGTNKKLQLKEIINLLKTNYCGTLSVQCAEALPDIRNWFNAEFEEGRIVFSKEEKKNIFLQINRTESLEKFIHTRYVGMKRFSIEGSDALIPMLEWLVPKSTSLGNEEIVIGMAHRGRINVLANFMEKGLNLILADFDGISNSKEEIAGYDGDVKYHLGYSTNKNTLNGPCHISLAFNPSHLECVNPVVCGMTRAKQRTRKDAQDRKKVIPLLIHGDAAFAGQGVVAETFQMSQLKGYTVGGTIHIIIDNQVGFTATPDNTRSSAYASDISKILHTPVLHVNGDDAEACVKAMDIAVRFRQEFKKDIVINLVCYRRFGHNEGDEPSFTSPLMYQVIKKHPTLREIYGKLLISENIIDQEHYESLFNKDIDDLQRILENIRKNPPVTSPLAFDGLWKNLRRSQAKDFTTVTDTTCDIKTLEAVGKVLSEIPPDFTPLPKLKKIVAQRRKMMDSGVVDWGLAELLCYGSLIKEGVSVRLSGQDSIRGTFSHRHSGYYDTKTGELHVPLKTLSENSEFCVYDSYLSEMAVLGFEYGNSISDPGFLHIWEAQFGDFANGAQIIIDQFISSGEAKWQRMTGLVLLLPHGYEGQGPEHSSARLERFLQLFAQDNMQVCNLTTPAQIFHVLRRQVKRDFRKPLIIMSPKSLLRHPRVISPLSGLAEGRFFEVLGDENIKGNQVETVVLCSGKIYYELLEEQETRKTSKTAIMRLEQISPFPKKQLMEELTKFKNLKRIIWAQEEPKNMGAYFFIDPHIKGMMDEFEIKKVDFVYRGRLDRASPATGSPKVHRTEQCEIVKACFQ